MSDDPFAIKPGGSSGPPGPANGDPFGGDPFGGGPFAPARPAAPSADDTVRQPLPPGGFAPGIASAGFLGSGASSSFRRPGYPAAPERPGFGGGFGDERFGAAPSTADALDFAAERSGGFGSDRNSGFGGLEADAYPAPDPAAARGDPAIDKAFALAALNPLVSAASPLLWLAGRLNESAPPDDVTALRERTLEEVRRFETAAMAQGIPGRIVRIARYMLAATLDDIVLNTGWGGASSWSSHSLVGILYNETWGGERFYDLLAQMQLSPADNIDALELAAICLAIGFVGKFRVQEGGAGQLSRLRQELYRTIRRVRGPVERSLSAGWTPIDAPHRPLPSLLGFWLAAALLVLSLGVLWAVSSLMLQARVEAAAEQLRALVPPIPVLAELPALPSVPDPVQQLQLTQVERISQHLLEDLVAARVEVAQTGDTVTVRMLEGAFQKADTRLTREALPLVARIARALEDEAGEIVVTGHTDSTPIAPGSLLGDNATLSLGRARAAAEVLQRHLADAGRVRYEGLADADPIASNATREGRARNRRVDFAVPSDALPDPREPRP